MSKNTSVYGIAKSQSQLEGALDRLRNSGFRAADISVLQPETVGTKDMGVENSTKSPEGAALGGASGALVGLGIPEYEAERYEGRVKDGGILLSIHCDDSEWTTKARTLLENSGFEDVSSSGEASADFSKTDKPMLRADLR
jgi:hypothetical protein